MITYREGMSVQQGERVAVYYNIHKGGFSIKSMDKRNPHNGKVVAYADVVMVNDAQFHIKPSGLRNIHKTGYKEIYATVRGTLIGTESVQTEGHRWGYCNPFTTETFVDWQTGVELSTAAEVYFYGSHFSYR